MNHKKLHESIRVMRSIVESLSAASGTIGNEEIDRLVAQLAQTVNQQSEWIHADEKQQKALHRRNEELVVALEHANQSHAACHGEVQRLRRVLLSYQAGLGQDDGAATNSESVYRMQRRIGGKLKRYFGLMANRQRTLQDRAASLLALHGSTGIQDQVSVQTRTLCSDIHKLSSEIDGLQTALKTDLSLLVNVAGKPILCMHVLH
jgi:hypothetical protein